MVHNAQRHFKVPKIHGLHDKILLTLYGYSFQLEQELNIFFRSPSPRRGLSSQSVMSGELNVCLHK